MKAYLVWNESRTEGIVVTDPGVAYEARKGASSNCFDRDGRQSKLAQYFCDLTADEPCEIEEIELPD